MPEQAPTVIHGTPPQRTTLTAQASRPVRRYLATEAGSGALLAVAAIVALVWANAWPSSYESLWHTTASISVGDWNIALTLQDWLGEGLMALFFFVVGLEVRREWSMGELTERRRAALPVLGAIGGMLVPIALYLALNGDGPAANGWGIVIATDTAFLLGVLAIVGPHVNTQLRIFLLTLSIVDDIIAISVIGFVYAEVIDYGALAIAATCLAVFWAFGRFQVRVELLYLLLWMLLWTATLESGLHPTIAGMAAGLLVNAYPPRRDDVEVAARLTKVFRQSPMPEVAREAKRSVDRAISPNERLIAFLHPWTAFVIVPLFALANAGVYLGDGVLGDALGSPVTWGVVLALVVGKLLGISVGALAPRQIGVGELPAGVGAGHVVAGAALSGIGFTVSLLIADLAFDDPSVRDEAKIGVLLAVAIAVLVGWIAFLLAAWLRGETDAALPTKLARPADPRLDHWRGRPDAPMVLVEYGDFECDFCSRATGMIHELRAELGDDLAYVFRHLPLEDVHPRAVVASQAAELAHDQGAFWPMHDLLFEHYDALELDDLERYAADLGLDATRLRDDIDLGRHGDRIRQDVAGAEASGARSTPTFFVNGERHVGPYDAATLAAELRATARD